MNLFLPLWQRARGPFLLAVAASLVTGFMTIALVGVINSVTSDPSLRTWATAAWFLGLTAVVVATRLVAQNLLYRMAQAHIADLRRTFSEAALRAPLVVTEKLGSSRLLSSLTDDIVLIGEAIPALPLVVSSIAFTLGAIAYMTWLAWPVGLVILGALVVGVAAYMLTTAGGRKELEAARTHQTQLFDELQDVASGMKELKQSRARRHHLVEAMLSSSLDGFRRHSVKGLTLAEGGIAVGQIVQFGLLGVVIYLVPRWFEISPATMASIVLVVLFTVANMSGMLNWLPILSKAGIAQGEVAERLALLEGAAEPESPTGQHSLPATAEQVELRGVRRTYPGPAGETFTLGPLSLDLRRGRIVFIIGANGSGKSTLAKLIAGLYAPDAGDLLIDGVDVTDDLRDDYRQLFSMVHADFHLFSWLPPDVDPDAHRAGASGYLQRLQLDHKVSVTEEGFSTTNLSQGQRKRLTLVSAYLEDRPFVVFDEWAADQDPVFKRVFYRELLPELRSRGKSVVVISHDDHYFDVADSVLRLEEGQLVEDRSRETVGVVQ